MYSKIRKIQAGLFMGLVTMMNFWLVSTAVAKDDINDQLQHAAGSSGANLGPAVDPRLTAALLIRIMVTLLGTIMVVIIVYAGFLWMTAGGEEEQITKAKGLIRNSIIGLIILLSAYGITIMAVNLATGYPLGFRTGLGGGLLGLFGI